MGHIFSQWQRVFVHCFDGANRSVGLDAGLYPTNSHHMPMHFSRLRCREMLGRFRRTIPRIVSRRHKSHYFLRSASRLPGCQLMRVPFVASFGLAELLKKETCMVVHSVAVRARHLPSHFQVLPLLSWAHTAHRALHNAYGFLLSARTIESRRRNLPTIS